MRILHTSAWHLGKKSFHDKYLKFVLCKNYKKLNLETFVLQIMFELVLESSNNRLLSMTIDIN